jgi:hypothetical protein
LSTTRKSSLSSTTVSRASSVLGLNLPGYLQPGPTYSEGLSVAELSSSLEPLIVDEGTVGRSQVFQKDRDPLYIHDGVAARDKSIDAKLHFSLSPNVGGGIELKDVTVKRAG